MKTESIEIRLSEQEKGAFAEAARICGLTVSAWIREVCRVQATADLAEAGRSDPFPEGA